MQNRDGGWAAFDRDNDNAVPDQRALRRPQRDDRPELPDITARVLELLGTLGHRADHPAVDAGRRLSPARPRSPTAAGSAAGASTTSTAPGRRCAGLPAVGFATSDPMVRRGGRLAASRSSSRAAAGASRCRSYDDPRSGGPGTPTASQTAWAAAGPDGRRRGRQREAVRARHRLPARARSAPTAPGTRTSSPAPASPGCSTSSTTSTRSTSR